VQCILHLRASLAAGSPVQNLRAGTIPPLPFKSSLSCLVRCCWGGQSMPCLSICTASAGARSSRLGRSTMRGWCASSAYAVQPAPEPPQPGNAGAGLHDHDAPRRAVDLQFSNLTVEADGFGTVLIPRGKAPRRTCSARLFEVFLGETAGPFLGADLRT
jgi:hypothetical protein